jgi:hypothetical protein
MGRTDSKSALPPTRDVFLPGTRVGVHQFGLVPVWESNSWRLQSASETIAEVNGAPIQLSTPRTRKVPNQLPQAVHLRQSLVNHVSVNGLRVDIFMLKTVREVYPIQTFRPVELRPQLQEVTHRLEAWAHDRYLQRPEQVSVNSYRVLERFTGKIGTAKFFCHTENSHELRHAEFLKFGKAKVDESLVRYLQSAEIDQIPAVITETHKGFETYAALEEGIKNQHPRVRFMIASKLLRRLFSALAFLNFHKVIHAGVTKEGVLLRLVDFKPEAVLLVDYSKSYSFPVGAAEPFKRMTDDGHAAMEIVESCCDLWQLRKAASKDTSSEEFMRSKTEATNKEFELMERVVADFFGPRGMSRKSKKGKNMLRLLSMKQHGWHKARNDQIHNATRREVGPCRSETIKEMELDWTHMHPSSKISDEQHMLLTLGHPYLDGLVSMLYHNRWDLRPNDVCTKIRKLAGDVEEPWQTFLVKLTASFTQEAASFEEHCILDWLASCCEICLEWRHAFVKECERHISLQNGAIKFADVKRLRDALVEYGTMPEFMRATFVRLTAEEIKNQPTTQIEEAHRVWYHKPSRMFNLTQLHRLAAPDRLLACINEGNIDCNNFVEVRGEPKIEGLYATVSLIAALSTQLGLTVKVPSTTPDFPLYDPADFSQVLYHIVLAHTGLLPWASVTRQGAQFNFHAPLSAEAPETAGRFLPTYFGSMNILPTMLYGRAEYWRPDHWSNFKTAKELDEAADLDKRTMLPAKRPLKKAASQLAKSHRVPFSRPDQSILAQTLKIRKRAFTDAQFPAKRNDGDQSSVAAMPAAKRLHVIPTVDNPTPSIAPSAPAPQFSTLFVNRQVDHMIANMERQSQPPANGVPPDTSSMTNVSFFQHNGGVNRNILVSPPPASAATKDTFTIVSNGDFNLEDDHKQAEDWLKVMNDDDAPQVAGIFGLNFHHSLRQQGDGSDTEADESCEENFHGETPAGGSEKAKQTDDQHLPNSFMSELKESSSFTSGPQVMTPTDRNNERAILKCFPSRQSFQLTTPKMSSPTFVRPALPATFLADGRGHRRNDISLSDLARVSLHNPHARSSPPPLATAINPPRPITPPDELDFSSPAWMMRGQGSDGDDDVPDTDQGEQFSDDSD